MRAFRFLLWLSLAGTLASCASNSERNLNEYRAHVAAVVIALESQGDADSLATAALLADSTPIDRAPELIARAVALAPERADLAWLHVALCQGRSNCDPAPLEDRLRAIDPANGASWFGPLERATVKGDGAELARALTALGRSERVDFYWVPTSRFAALAIERTQRWTRIESLIAVMGKLAAEAIPQFQYVSKSCKSDALADAAQLVMCRGVARALMSGDTFLTEFIGIAIAKRVWTEDTEEGARVRAVERVDRYRMNAWADLRPKDPVNEKWAKNYLEETASLRSEQQVAVAQLTRAGIPLDPPAATPAAAP